MLRRILFANLKFRRPEYRNLFVRIEDTVLGNDSLSESGQRWRFRSRKFPMKQTENKSQAAFRSIFILFVGHDYFEF